MGEIQQMPRPYTRQPHDAVRRLAARNPHFEVGPVDQLQGVVVTEQSGLKVICRQADTAIGRFHAFVAEGLDSHLGGLFELGDIAGEEAHAGSAGVVDEVPDASREGVGDAWDSDAYPHLCHREGCSVSDF